MTLPFSASAERNKSVIADALAAYFDAAGRVLEIGSGSGQHAVFFCERFAHLQWQPTDREENLPGIRQWIDQSQLTNVDAPLILDVNDYTPTTDRYSFAYSANTAHIMSEEQVNRMFDVVGAHLAVGGHFALYGPFRFNGKHNAQSNADFDLMLREQAQHMGIRDKSRLDAFAGHAGLEFIEGIEMPSNNHLLIWRRG